MRFISKLLMLVLLLFGLSAPVFAKFVFGNGETVRFVANTTITAPDGARLYLGRKITTHSFLLPYSATDDGYVLGVSGDSKRYFPLPAGAQLEKLQLQGALPKPLPAWEFSEVDWLFHHSLWLGLAGLALWAAYSVMKARRVKKLAESNHNSPFTSS
jgi:hypothetical protein